ncbi:GntR family transcriptional regulator [Roseobacter litoralis]|uniref:GntR family transcriptional regulator n=1 Tax=Roseobacter litoralis TaxID=42443 RepID=UPI0031E536C9
MHSPFDAAGFFPITHNLINFCPTRQDTLCFHARLACARDACSAQAKEDEDALPLLGKKAKGRLMEYVKRPVHQSVYEDIRDQILFGDMAPGQAVTIQGLADTLKAGMTPVREAIRRLTSDGALNMTENRRVSVPVITHNCIEELEFMRKTLEPELARRAVSKITDAAKEVLRAHDNALNSAISQGDIKGYLTHNYHFHATLYQAAEAPIMTATVDRLWLRFGPSLRVVCGRHGTMNLPDKHADLLAALDRNDATGVLDAMAEDVHQGMIQIREALHATTEPN